MSLLVAYDLESLEEYSYVPCRVSLNLGFPVVSLIMRQGYEFLEIIVQRTAPLITSHQGQVITQLVVGDVDLHHLAMAETARLLTVQSLLFLSRPSLREPVPEPNPPLRMNLYLPEGRSPTYSAWNSSPVKTFLFSPICLFIHSFISMKTHAFLFSTSSHLKNKFSMRGKSQCSIKTKMEYRGSDLTSHLN